MITKEQIEQIAGSFLGEGELFLTSVKVGAGNQISVFIDGDSGVKIDDCVNLSRFIEKSLDRDKEDFTLDVSSHGATNPLVLPRQYKKHIGRSFEIKLLNGEKAEGDLVSVNENEIVLEYTVRENKPVGKGKVNVTKQTIINFNQIKESKIKLKF